MRVLVVDGSNLIWRAYAALPKLSTRSGHPTGATFGFMRTVFSHCNRFEATEGIVAFDVIGSSSRRRQIDPLYKGDRLREDMSDFFVQWDDTKELLERASFTVLESKEREADDLIYSVVKGLVGDERVEAIRVLSADHDLMQCLLDDRVELIRPIPKKGEEIWTRSKVIREIGIEPERLPELWALCGDPGDCIPSVLGRMKALEVLRSGSLESYVQHCDNKADSARILVNLALVRAQDWYQPWKLQPIRWTGATETFQRLEFASILKKLGVENGVVTA